MVRGFIADHEPKSGTLVRLYRCDSDSQFIEVDPMFRHESLHSLVCIRENIRGLSVLT